MIGIYLIRNCYDELWWWLFIIEEPIVLRFVDQSSSEIKFLNVQVLFVVRISDYEIQFLPHAKVLLLNLNFTQKEVL